MKPLTKLYLKAFAINTLFMMVVYPIIYSAFFEERITLRLSIFTSVFNGIIFSIIIVRQYRTRYKKLGVTEFTEEALSNKQMKTITSTITKEELIARLKSSLYFKKMKMIVEENQINLSSGWGTRGEKINIEIDHNNSANTFLISSNPKLKLNFPDGGKSLENVMMLEKLILHY